MGQSGGSSSPNRCSEGLAPPWIQAEYPYYDQTFRPEKYWNGIKVHIPAHGTEALLAAPASATHPSDGRVYVGVTASRWRIGCLSAVQNAEGEGFVARLPDGTTYYFDWMVRKRRPSFMSGGVISVDAGHWSDNSSTDSSSPKVLVPREDVFLFATRVEDQFGNYLSYEFDPALPHRIKSIRSSDGQVIAISYNAAGRISTVALNGRVWRYEYSGSTSDLLRVINPDGSRWEYSHQLSQLFSAEEQDVRAMQDKCIVSVGTMVSTVAPDPSDVGHFTVTAPSGAKATFRIRELVHGTNRAQGSCIHDKAWYYGDPPFYTWVTVVEGVPLITKLPSVYEKVVDGVGLPAAVWKYAYESSWSYESQCASGTCGSTTRTIIDGPYGKRTVYTFGNDFQTNIGRLLEVSTSADGVEVTRESQSYLQSSSGQPFLDAWGIPLMDLVSPEEGKNRPRKGVHIRQAGTSFEDAVVSYDAWARPVVVDRFSSIGTSRRDVTEYHDTTALWVLGQVVRRYEANSGVIFEKTDYNTKAQP